MLVEQYPSIVYVRQCLRYQDGRLFWLERPREHFTANRVWNIWNARFAGKEAGNINQSRCMVTLDKQRLFRYWIVWALHHDEWRLGLDHENRDSLDDRIENLRTATQGQNLANATLRSDNKSGYKGVTWRAQCRRWWASIRIDGHTRGLGLFDDPAEAHAVYLAAAVEVWGEFACSGDT
jgi:hypothetical protein